MATWGDYQSVIQLAAGLNFAYASLEVILDRPLLTISTRQQALIDRLRQVAQAKSEPIPTLDATVYCDLRDNLDGVTGLHGTICHLNPYISAICGMATTALLFHASENAGVVVNPAEIILITAIGFAWFCTVLIAMAALRLFLILLVEPKLQRLKS